MASVNNIMKLFGMSGIAESAPIKGHTKVKKYNAERYMEAYSFIRADEFKAQAEAAQVRNYVLTAKARGEADNEIIKKVKNAGTDLWRKVKELLGKLMIVIEEFFAKLFDKTKPLRKMQMALEKEHEKFKNRLKDSSFELDDDYTLRLPKIFVDNIDSNDVDHLTNKRKTNDTYYNDLDITIFDKPAISRNSQDTTDSNNILNVYKLQKDVAWFSYVKNAISGKANKNLFKDIRNHAKSIYNTGALGSLTVSSTTNPLNTHIQNFINAGLTIETLQQSLYNEQRTLQRNKIYIATEDYKLSHIQLNNKRAGVSNGGKLLVIITAGIKLIADAARSIETISNESKVIKLALNKIKNAPTSVTGSLKPEILQIIRKMCTEANKAINIKRKTANVKASNNILLGKDLLDVIRKANDKFEDNLDEDNVIQGRRSIR